jgi:hypothetical protein
MSTSEYRPVTTAEELRAEVESLSNQPVIGFDTETTDLDPYKGDLRLVQLAAPDGVRIIDLYRFGQGDLSKLDALEPLRRLLAAPRQRSWAGSSILCWRASSSQRAIRRNATDLKLSRPASSTRRLIRPSA